MAHDRSDADENAFPPTWNDDPTSPFETATTPAGRKDLSRRTVVTGAAWTIPVIMASAVVPVAAAASAQTVTLAFDKSSYTANGCGTISGVKITATVNNTGRAGISVSVTLPKGYTYSTGATTYSGTTDSSGVVTLPNITTPGAGGNTVFTAVAAAGTTTSSANTTSNVSVSQNIIAATATNAAPGSTFSSVPSGSLPLGGAYFLATNGDLYYQNTKIVSGVNSARVFASPSDTFVSYVTSSGGARAAGATVVATYSGVPSSATSVGADYFLGTDGSLYYQATKIASGVSSAAGSYRNGHFTVDYIDSSNARQTFWETSIQSTVVNYPASSIVPATALGGGYFITSGGDLYYGNSKVASGVISAYAYPEWTEWVACSWNTSSGCYRANIGGLTAAYGAIPTDAVSVGADYFLTASGDLYFRGTRCATGITSAAGCSRDGKWTVDAVDTTGRIVYLENGVQANGGTRSQTPAISYATPLGGTYALMGDGTLYYGDSVVATGVISANAFGDWTYWVACSFSTAYSTYEANVGGIIAQYPAVPIDAVSLGADYFLTPGGDLWFRGSQVATGVASAAGSSRGRYYTCEYIDGNGRWHTVQETSVGARTVTDQPGPQYPVGTLAIGGWCALTPSGDLYCADSLMLSQVKSAVGWIGITWKPQANVVGTDGKVRFVDWNTVTTRTTNFTNPQVLKAQFVLDSSKLYFGDQLVASGVRAAQGQQKDDSIASIVYSNGTVGSVVRNYNTGAITSATYNGIKLLPKAVGGGITITPAGNVYSDGVLLLSNVMAAQGCTADTWKPLATMLGLDGKVHFADWTTLSTFTTDYSNTGVLTYPQVLRAGYVLGTDGTLRYMDSVVATGVYSAQASVKDNPLASVVLSTGVAKRANGASITDTFSSIVNRPYVIGSGFGVTPNGALFYDSTQVMGSVTSAAAWSANGSTPRAAAVGTDGKMRQITWTNNAASTTTLTADFTGAQALRGGYSLTSGGTLYSGDTQVETGVFRAQGAQQSDATVSYFKYGC